MSWFRNQNFESRKYAITEAIGVALFSPAALLVRPTLKEAQRYMNAREAYKEQHGKLDWGFYKKEWFTVSFKGLREESKKFNSVYKSLGKDLLKPFSPIPISPGEAVAELGGMVGDVVIEPLSNTIHDLHDGLDVSEVIERESMNLMENLEEKSEELWSKGEEFVDDPLGNASRELTEEEIEEKKIEEREADQEAEREEREAEKEAEREEREAEKEAEREEREAEKEAEREEREAEKEA
ncbi:hypothetical protein OCA08_20000, partial [Bacillus cereus]|nr:hypothetical protein [Bacillus cereus]